MGTETQTARFIHRLTVPLIFPAGLAPGGGKDEGNTLVLARGGLDDQVVLRGSAVAGVLRSAYARSSGEQSPKERERALHRWFGRALGDDGARHDDRPSPLRVADAVLDQGKAAPRIRTHNAIDRHSGAVRDQGLFSLEALAPGTKATLVLWVEDPEDVPAQEFLAQLLGLLRGGLIFGGNGARGIGRAVVREGVRHRRFALGELEDYVAWLDESWAWRSQGEIPTSGDGLEPVRAEADDDGDTLEVDFELAVPRGQDVCVADGVGLDHAIEPHRTSTASGQVRWRIPGSALRGVFRSWVSRLAARAAAKGQCSMPADSVSRFEAHGAATGDDVGWGFVDGQARAKAQERIAQDPAALAEVITCPVMRLFGSLFGAGRIHIADALSTQVVDDRCHTQYRKHVAIDRVTGGASEGFLFEHVALVRGPTFRVTLTVREPNELEARWLASTIRALDLGLLRVGSSKSAGRLALAGPPRARGPHHSMFTSIQPIES